ncbi:hypothetical protein AHIS1_p071 [Acaryochloris phage A-HIS1]|nr:hypothetical protein AHIS1_p071 [Acaryochloris phage A-HIS1]
MEQRFFTANMTANEIMSMYRQRGYNDTRAHVGASESEFTAFLRANGVRCVSCNQ